jgi:hypothetical protein
VGDVGHPPPVDVVLLVVEALELLELVVVVDVVSSSEAT